MFLSLSKKIKIRDMKYKKLYMYEKHVLHGKYVLHEKHDNK